MNIDQLIARLKKLTATLSAGQLAGLAAVFLAVVGVVVGSAYWMSQPKFTLLLADMDADTASSVISKLKEQKVAYELTDGGRAVSVPAEKVDELRLAMTSDGMPSAGRIGFEIFDRTAFGTTEFLEHVNYRRALEGELGRTIATLTEVASARVHIAMAKDSLFVDQEQPAKASVVLRLKANRPMAPSTVKGIANLVAASVESLRPESVVILDTYGRSLTNPQDGTDDASTDTADLDRQQQIERDLTTQVSTLLEPVVGAGRVRVNVAAHLNQNAIDETEEKWDPNAVVRSKQTSSETGATPLSAGGIAGARANQPPTAARPVVAAAAPPVATPAATPTPGAPAAPAPAGLLALNAPPAPAGASKTSETTNYEVGRVTRHTVSPQGQLARLSVAVILDDERVTAKGSDGTVQTTSKPWDTQGIQRIHDLVAAAVGFDAQRGDQLTVENMAFDVAPTEPDVVAPPVSQQLLDGAKQYWPSALRGVGVISIACFALFGVLRPLMRRATTFASTPALPAGAGAARLPTVKEMEGQMDADIEASGQPRRLPALTKRVAKLASEEPEQLARIVRGWISEEER